MDGIPDFSAYSHPDIPKDGISVEGLTGSRGKDNLLSNNAAGGKFADFKRKAPTDGTIDYIWHHVPGGDKMQLVQKNVHETFWHKGGASDILSGGK